MSKLTPIVTGKDKLGNSTMDAKPQGIKVNKKAERIVNQGIGTKKFLRAHKKVHGDRDLISLKITGTQQKHAKSIVIKN